MRKYNSNLDRMTLLNINNFCSQDDKNNIIISQLLFTILIEIVKLLNIYLVRLFHLHIFFHNKVRC